MSHIKVFFIAKIKNLNEEYKQKNKELMDIASTLPGFISIKSEEIDDIEITVSCWKDKESIQEWATNSVHVEIKERAKEWYHWVKGIHVEAVDELSQS
tara:strand:- start:854 stop:1147 length:294 start_codon:yes stop_codon:yes gene_type:complete